MSVKLEAPNYSKFIKTENGRIWTSKREKQGLRVVAPIFFRFRVSLEKREEHLQVPDSDLPFLLEQAYGVAATSIVEAETRTVNLENKVQLFEAGLVHDEDRIKKESSVSNMKFVESMNASIAVDGVALDTLDDENDSRRRTIYEVLQEGLAVNDAVLISSIPISWAIPDEDFTPPSSIQDLWASSSLYSWARSWGVVINACIVFKQTDKKVMALCYQFRDVKAMRQCIIALYDRYLWDGDASKWAPCKVICRPCRYEQIVAGASAMKSATDSLATSKRPRLGSNNDTDPQQLAPPLSMAGMHYFTNPYSAALQMGIGNGQMPQPMTYRHTTEQLPMDLQACFAQMIEKMEKLETENTRLFNLLVKSAGGYRIGESKDEEVAPWRQGI